MAGNQVNGYDIDPHIAEIYDQREYSTGDIELIRRLIGQNNRWRILEPFCGTGRVLIPLALDGHAMVGLDQAKGMLERAKRKISQLPPEAQERITLSVADVLTVEWPQEFDLVILGGNCFYELATPQEQEHSILSAAKALKTGGYLYVDNDHMEGDLDESWQDIGTIRNGLSGTCQDDTKVESSKETVWVDVPHRLVKLLRRVKVTLPDGKGVEKEYIQQKHPVSAVELRGWLEHSNFDIKHTFGDHTGNLYSDSAKRAIFWARKQ